MVSHGSGTRNQTGSIYFVLAREVGLVKIGFSNNLKKRMYDLQIGSPVKLELLKTVESNQNGEQALLAIFYKYRVHGEWFKAVPDLMNFIEKLAHGENFSPEMLVQK